MNKNFFICIFAIVIVFIIIFAIVETCPSSSVINKKPVQKRVVKESITYDTKIIVLEVDGIKHEFINYSANRENNGIAHWPDCKYCKNNKK